MVKGRTIHEGLEIRGGLRMISVCASKMDCMVFEVALFTGESESGMAAVGRQKVEAEGPSSWTQVVPGGQERCVQTSESPKHNKIHFFIINMLIMSTFVKILPTGFKRTLRLAAVQDGRFRSQQLASLTRLRHRQHRYEEHEQQVKLHFYF